MKRVLLALALVLAPHGVGAVGIPFSLKLGNATSDRVTVAETAPMINMTSFTVAVRAKITSYRNVDTFVGKRATGGLGWHMVVDGTTGQFSFGLGFTTSIYVKSVTNTLLLNEWVCLAATTNSASNNHIYIQRPGERLREPSLTNNDAASGSRSSDAGLPVLWGNWNSNTRSLSGYESAGILVPHILDVTQIDQWCRNPASIDGALMFFIFGQNGTGRVIDLSGSGNHGTITGAIPTSENDPYVFWRRPF